MRAPSGIVTYRCLLWLIGLLAGTLTARAQMRPVVAGAGLLSVAIPKNVTDGMPTGRFLTDSIDIGRPFQYSLSVWHRAGEDVFFPDTSRSFAPFQVRAVALFTTRTLYAATPDAISLDSAVYTLVSFNTGITQILQVPVRMTNDADSVALLATPDTVYLRSHLPVGTTPGALTLASETAIVPLRQQFNYPYLLLSLLTLVVVMGVIYGLFNQPIQRQWQLYRLDQRHIRFLRAFNQLTVAINAETAADVTNRAIVRWKMYLERLEQQSFSSLTSREIADRFGDASLTDALRESDQMIYGGAFSETSQAALQVLRQTADRLYREQRDRMRQPVAARSTGTDPVFPDSEA